MPGVLAWGYYPTDKIWLPIQVDANGRIKADMSAINLDDLGDVSVAAPTDGYVLYWDAATSLWKCKAIPAAAWAAITGKPTAPSLEELATEHDASGLHTGEIVLADTDIPAGIARDAEVATAVSDHAAIAAAHHARYTDAEAKAAAVLAGAITDAETKAPTHDAVYDVKTTADGAIAKALLTERGSVIFRNASAPAELLHGTVGQVLQSGGHNADPSWATAAGGTKIQDADADTKVDVEEAADEDKIRMDVAGVEAFLLETDGILTLAKQSSTRVYLSAAQSIPFTTWTKVNINTDSYDVQNESDLVNYRITVKDAGKYAVVAFTYYWTAADGKTVYTGIYKNGVQYAVNLSYASASGDLGAAMLDILSLAANDYVELYTWQNIASPKSTTYGSSVVFLSVTKIA